MGNGVRAKARGKETERSRRSFASLQCLSGESSSSRLTCSFALQSPRSNLDCLADGRPDAPASWGAFFLGLPSQAVPSTTHHPRLSRHPLLLLGLLHPQMHFHPLLSLQRVLGSPLPQIKLSAGPPGPLTYGAAVHAGVGGPWLGHRLAQGGGGVWVVLGGDSGALGCPLTSAEAAALLSGPLSRAPLCSRM